MDQLHLVAESRLNRFKSSSAKKRSSFQNMSCTDSAELSKTKPPSSVFLRYLNRRSSDVKNEANFLLEPPSPCTFMLRGVHVEIEIRPCVKKATVRLQQKRRTKVPKRYGEWKLEIERFDLKFFGKTHFTF